MLKLSYLAMLIFTMFASFWLEIAFKVHVLRRMKRVLLSLLPISLGFLIWDAYAIAQGHWYFDQKQVTGIQWALQHSNRRDSLFPHHSNSSSHDARRCGPH